MKCNWKKITALFGAICILGTTTAGCGSDSGTAETVKTEEASPADSAQQEPEAPKEEETQKPEETPAEQEGRWHVLDPEVAAAVDADFCGTVWKLEEDRFYIAEEQVILEEDGSIMSSSPSSNADIPDSELIPVVFDEDTHFYLRTVYGNGESYEDSDAGFSDLEKGVSVEMKGSFEKDVFHAKEIRIVKVS